MRNRAMCAALASIDTHGSFKPLKGPESNGTFTAFASVTSDFRIREIPARWVPASTASTDPLFHSVDVERTRKAVALSSKGPPPEP